LTNRVENFELILDFNSLTRLKYLSWTSQFDSNIQVKNSYLNQVLTSRELDSILMTWLDVISLVMKYCFFVNELDEFNKDQIKIIMILKDLVTSLNIKICLSSWSWNHFMKAFDINLSQMLRLKKLIQDDILLYIKSTFKENSCFMLLSAKNSRCNELVQEIIENAYEVFLWVFLVIRFLLRDLTHADDIYIMQITFMIFKKDFNFCWMNLKLTFRKCLRTLKLFIKRKQLKPYN